MSGRSKDDCYEEEEWKEVEEEKEKDYSGLRIANLQIADKVEEGEEEGDENQDEDNEDGEGKERRDKGEQGPWKSGATTAPTAVQPEHPATPVEEPKKEEPKPTGKYVPPSQRAAAAAGGTTTPSGPTVPSHLRRKKEMPNLKSEEEFPTLGGNAPPIPVDSDPTTFERVQHGGRQIDDPTKVTQQLSLGNKFSALQD
ncbi:hypothetical protein DPMN_074869 [Dreissena polymorpha]|uniref:Uncharacterized protein n=1 Tax=Dreissena polymorpha TaxID=45954 RepID=A0A9D3YFS7_DREPO|nr:hypothetical protein DPMN_074869 [Dreissena polymorpha]